MGWGPALRSVFKGMERSFRPEAAQGFTGEIQYELTGQNGSRRWTLRIDEAHAIAVPGRALSPAVTLRMNVPTFARILTREEEPGRAFLEGWYER